MASTTTDQYAEFVPTNPQYGSTGAGVAAFVAALNKLKHFWPEIPTDVFLVGSKTYDARVLALADAIGIDPTVKYNYNVGVLQDDEQYQNGHNVGLVFARMADSLKKINATVAWVQFLVDNIVPGITAEQFTESVTEVDAAALLNSFLTA